MEFACPLERVEQFTVVQLTFLEAARPLAGNLALNEPAEDQVHRLTAGRCTNSAQTSSVTWTRAM